MLLYSTDKLLQPPTLPNTPTSPSTSPDNNILPNTPPNTTNTPPTNTNNNPPTNTNNNPPNTTNTPTNTNNNPPNITPGVTQSTNTVGTGVNNTTNKASEDLQKAFNTMTIPPIPPHRNHQNLSTGIKWVQYLLVGFMTICSGLGVSLLIADDLFPSWLFILMGVFILVLFILHFGFSMALGGSSTQETFVDMAAGLEASLKTFDKTWPPEFQKPMDEFLKNIKAKTVDNLGLTPGKDPNIKPRENFIDDDSFDTTINNLPNELLELKTLLTFHTKLIDYFNISQWYINNNQPVKNTELMKLFTDSNTSIQNFNTAITQNEDKIKGLLLSYNSSIKNYDSFFSLMTALISNVQSILSSLKQPVNIDSTSTFKSLQKNVNELLLNLQPPQTAPLITLDKNKLLLIPGYYYNLYDERGAINQVGIYMYNNSTLNTIFGMPHIFNNNTLLFPSGNKVDNLPDPIVLGNMSFTYNQLTNECVFTSGNTRIYFAQSTGIYATFDKTTNNFTKCMVFKRNAIMDIINNIIYSPGFNQNQNTMAYGYNKTTDNIYRMSSSLHTPFDQDGVLNTKFFMNDQNNGLKVYYFAVVLDNLPSLQINLPIGLVTHSLSINITSHIPDAQMAIIIDDANNIYICIYGPQASQIYHYKPNNNNVQTLIYHKYFSIKG